MGWTVGEIIIVLSFRVSLLRDSMMLSALNYFYLCYCSLKQKDQREKQRAKKMLISEIRIITILICQKLQLIGPVQQKN